MTVPVSSLSNYKLLVQYQFITTSTLWYLELLSKVSLTVDLALQCLSLSPKIST